MSVSSCLYSPNVCIVQVFRRPPEFPPEFPPEDRRSHVLARPYRTSLVSVRHGRVVG